MPQPVCVKCRREMRCNKNGRVLEIVSGGFPYQLWSGDEYVCPECGAQVITRYGGECIAQHYGSDDPDRYERFLQFEKSRNNVVTIDC